MDVLPKIEFAIEEGLVGVAPEPVPAASELPPWVTKLKAHPAPTAPDVWPLGSAKACAPFMDAMAAGYLLRLPQAIRVVCRGDEIYFGWRVARLGAAVEQHTLDQVEGSGLTNAYKFVMPYTVRVPDGYSVLYTHPFNRYDLPFLAISGVVEGEYRSPVHIPFTWIGSRDGETYLDAGTPVAQLVPFARADWEHEIVADSDANLMRDGLSAMNALQGYRRRFHQKKVYR